MRDEIRSETCDIMHSMDPTQPHSCCEWVSEELTRLTTALAEVTRERDEAKATHLSSNRYLDMARTSLLAARAVLAKIGGGK